MNYQEKQLLQKLQQFKLREKGTCGLYNILAIIYYLINE
jgi:hypothetical protein